MEKRPDDDDGARLTWSWQKTSSAYGIKREREIHPDIVPWKFTVAADDVTQTHNAIRRLRFHFHSQAFFSIARVHVAQAYIGNMPTIILHEDYIDMLDSMLTGTRETE